MYIYHLLYDVAFITYDSENDMENEIPTIEIKALIPEIGRNISNHYDFDFHFGLIGYDFENIAWAFPYVDIFDGKVYFVVEMGFHKMAHLSIEEVTQLSNLFCERDCWEQHFSVEYHGLPIYVNVNWESSNELSFKYTRSVHYNFYEFMNSSDNPMTNDSNQLIRAYFYKLKNKYPEIEVLQSTFIYESVCKDRSKKLHRLLFIANKDSTDGSEDYDEQENYLELLAQTYETYKNLKHWSSKEMLEDIKYFVDKIAETTVEEAASTVIQRFEDVQNAVLVLREQLHDLTQKTSKVSDLPDSIKDCMKEFHHL